MACQITDEEKHEDTVKPREIAVDEDYLGKPVDKPDKKKKACPFTLSICLESECAFFADELGICGILAVIRKVLGMPDRPGET